MDTKINVLAISYGRNLFDAHNTERQRMELCAGAVDEYHMIIFTRKSDSLSEVRAQNGLVLHPTNSKTRFHMVSDAIRIGSRLLRQRAGQWVLTTQDPFEAGLVGYILSRRHVVKLNMQEHGDFFSSSAWRKESLLNTIRFYVGKWLLRKADTVRVVSARMETTMRSIGVDASRILRLAVRTDDAEESGTVTVDLHAEYPDASVIILSMARFVPQKNLSLLIRAFADVHAKNAAALLVILGEGVQQQKLHDVVGALKLEHAVVIKPWTDTPHAYIRSADVYALSSNYEGWGRVLIEAMRMGTPIVTTDVGCAGEVVEDGVHGFVVPVGDTESFTQRLQQLADNPALRNQFAHSGQKDAAHVHISPDAYTTAWVHILHQTLKA